MSDHLSSCTDRLVTSDHLNSEKRSNESIESSGESSRAQGTKSMSTTKSMDNKTDKEEEEHEKRDVTDEEEPLIQSVECRICQEEDSVKNLESPCSCSGILISQMVTWVETDLFTLVLGFLMLSTGLTLTFEDFRRCLRNPWMVGVGFLAQYMIKPLLGVCHCWTRKVLENLLS